MPGRDPAYLARFDNPPPFLDERGDPTDDADRLFSYHSCWVLAWALSQQTGWPLLAVTDADPSPEGTLAWVHVAVQTPEGTVLDVRGEHTPDEFLDVWADFTDDPEEADLTPVPPDRFVHMLTDDPACVPAPFMAATDALAAALLTRRRALSAAG